MIEVGLDGRVLGRGLDDRELINLSFLSPLPLAIPLAIPLPPLPPLPLPRVTLFISYSHESRTGCLLSSW